MSDFDNKAKGMEDAFERFKNRGTNPEAEAPPVTPEPTEPIPDERVGIFGDVDEDNNQSADNGIVFEDEPTTQATITEEPTYETEPASPPPPPSKPPTPPTAISGEEPDQEPDDILSRDTSSKNPEIGKLLPGEATDLTSILPSPAEVENVINEPDEDIDIDKFIRELKEEDEEEHEAMMEIAEETPREKSRKRLLDLAKDPEESLDGLPSFRAAAREERAIDMDTSETFAGMSSKAISVINALFASDNCSEIHGDAPDKLFARYNGKRVAVEAEFSSDKEYNNFLKSLVDRAETAQTWDDLKDKSSGVVQLADGSSLTLTFPPFTKNACFTVRKHTAQKWNFDRLVDNGTLNKSMADFLKTSVAGRANIIIAGELGAGKTTMLSLLTNYIPDGERIALMQEVPEIFIHKPDVVKFTYYPMMYDNKYTLDKIIDVALYMRFDRMIVGEMHDKGLFYLLKVMRTGGDGSMSTFHAGSARELGEMFVNHLQREGGNFTAETAAQLVRSAVDIVVILEHQGMQHRVIEIAEVDRRTTNTNNASMIATNTLWKFERTGNLEGKHICKNKPDDSGRLVQKMKRYGMSYNPEWFAAAGRNMEIDAKRGRRS